MSSFGYTRVEEWDPEEKKHREAQFLIYKSLQQVERIIGLARKQKQQTLRPGGSGLIRLRISKLREKIGRRLIRVRTTLVFGLSKARAGLCKHLSARLKLWARLFQDGAAAPPSTAVVRLPQPLLA